MDNDKVQRDKVKILKGNNIKVLQSNDIKGGIVTMGKKKPDLILVGVDMPAGYGAIQAIRNKKYKGLIIPTPTVEWA